MRTAARAYLLAGVAATVVYVVAGGVDAIYESLGLCAAAAIVVGVVCNRPVARGGWLALARSQAMLALGDLVYFNAFGDSPQYPSVADGLYLAGIVVLGVALAVLAAVDSAPGEGTIFTVRLPLARVPSELLPERPALATLVD